ncbi:hypothetical protein GGR16_001428 [Chelatococcus caeni]|uniref:Uncharacterized protein n=3 Tax=Chelatococcus TaxID=28209 RepID=A0A840BXK1_9HYPH|nr:MULTISPECIES: hypothetical protein [Chelatococcus]ALA19135.1 hypothetical protein AL346_19135 [Chelatococcus sp. CO-6]APF37571.1 hypothetical protein BOQ54_09705 [Chelatococcus daeguensis]MBB4016422.1 hypothetical protein [Chelatococcus caeni]
MLLTINMLDGAFKGDMRQKIVIKDLIAQVIAAQALSVAAYRRIEVTVDNARQLVALVAEERVFETPEIGEVTIGRRAEQILMNLVSRPLPTKVPVPPARGRGAPAGGPAQNQ